MSYTNSHDGKRKIFRIYFILKITEILPICRAWRSKLKDIWQTIKVVNIVIPEIDPFRFSENWPKKPNFPLSKSLQRERTYMMFLFIRSTDELTAINEKHWRVYERPMQHTYDYTKYVCIPILMKCSEIWNFGVINLLL